MPQPTIITKKRLPSGSACSSCRRRKNRCDSRRPKCSHCQSRGIECEYPAVRASQLSLDE
ncbi:hypothetical protein F5884DRAFT_764712 [Xylogone sp. PMI_703]|nr:hypothetical protein F5884DRAFT_764712 [Xylogone sp. PMI_703]